MAFALSFDGIDEYGQLPINWQATGDFTITTRFTYDTHASHSMFLGPSSGTTNGIRCWAGGLIQGRINNNVVDVTIPTLTQGDIVDVIFSRVGTLVTFSVNTVSNTMTNSDSLFLRTLGSNGGTQQFYEGDSLHLYKSIL